MGLYKNKYTSKILEHKSSKWIFIFCRKIFTNGTIEYLGTGIIEYAEVAFGKYSYGAKLLYK